MTAEVSLPQPGDNGVTPEEVDQEMTSAYGVHGAWGTSPVRLVLVDSDGIPTVYAAQEVAIFGGAMHIALGEWIGPAEGNEASWAIRATADLR
jgi:hypothetical protein